jgi:L-2-hydroxyglutarate oxidase LhgO
MEAFNALAIDVRTKTVVEAIDKTDSGFVVHARSDRKSETFEADFVVHAAGCALLLKNSTLLRPTYKLKRVGSS